MPGEIYLADDPRGGFLAIHVSASGDSSGCDGPFSSHAGAVEAASDMARRYGAKFLPPAGRMRPVEGKSQTLRTAPSNEEERS